MRLPKKFACGVTLTAILSACTCTSTSTSDAQTHARGASEQTKSVAVDVPLISPADKDALETRRREIEAEIATLGLQHPWAGEYRWTAVDLTDTIVIAPGVGYEHRSAHNGTTRVLSSGSVRVHSGTIVLQPQLARDVEHSAAATWLVVRWGARRYLLREDELIAFCNSVNRGDEDFTPSNYFHAVRTKGAEKRAGRPELPSPYDGYILAAPLTAHITRVLVPGERFELDIGRDQGVFMGMELRVRAPAPVGGKFLVVSNHDATCEVEVRSSDPGSFTTGQQLLTGLAGH